MRYKSCRIIGGKRRKVIIEDGKIVKRDPTKEELEYLEEEPYIIKQYTDNELLEFIRQFNEKNGRPPTENDFNNDRRYPSVPTYQKRFGSWNNAIEIAGLPKRKITKEKHSDEKLLRFPIIFYEKNGRPPTERDFCNNPEYPSSSCYYRRFGSWNNALKLVGLDTDSMIRKGIIKNARQKGRLFEICVLEHFIEEPIDLAGDNCTSFIDGICPTGHTYDAKSTGLVDDRYWMFYLNKKGEVNFYYLGAFDKDYKNLLHVWRIPEDIIDKDYLYIGIDDRYKYNIENMRKYEITEKFADIDIFKEVN